MVVSNDCGVSSGKPTYKASIGLQAGCGGWGGLQPAEYGRRKPSRIVV